VLIVVLGVIAVGLVAGFISFVHAVGKENSDTRAADGIVALTGGQDRLTDALALLQSGRAQRLLITGVNPTTSGDQLEKQVPRFAEFAACCVDIDRRAATTVGNAVETRRWVEHRGFRSIIVVTSGYHMPRALTELSRALPNVALIPHPVVTDKLREENWWRDPLTVRLLFSEYLKYLLAMAKLRLAPNPEDFTSAGYTARL
jgi:uncharacterized SAM-binding protein YcdF (DUF218 family)